MAISLPPVKLPAGQWVDLYVATGISVGVPLAAQNTGTTNVVVSESVAMPTVNYGYNIIEPVAWLFSDEEPVGAWAFSSSDGKLQVEEDS